MTALPPDPASTVFDIDSLNGLLTSLLTGIEAINTLSLFVCGCDMLGVFLQVIAWFLDGDFEPSSVHFLDTVVPQDQNGNANSLYILIDKLTLRR